jgi:membrane protein implicated in regulation of membrane protease activity
VLFGLSGYLNVPVVSQLFYGLAVIAVFALLPGSLLGLLSLNMHSAGFLTLSLLGDVAFYSFVAHRVLARRERSSNRHAKVKS